jgi:hypothetical protein
MKSNRIIKPYLKVLITLCFFVIIFLLLNSKSIYPDTAYKEKNQASIPINKIEALIENPSEINDKETFIIKNNNIKILDYKKITPEFIIHFGDNKKDIGKIKYDPGATNGISGGAIPTDVKTRNNEILIADGYGPRIVKYSETGKYIGEIDLKELRPYALSEFKALCGFKFSYDSKNNLYVLDMEKSSIWIYSTDKTIKKIDLKDVLKEYFTILDIHPYILVSKTGNLLLKLTVSKSKNEENYGYDYIPTKTSEIRGVAITSDGKFIATYDPNYSFIDINDIFYTISSVDEKGFKISGYIFKGSNFILHREIFVEDPGWEHGDLIESLQDNKIYYLSKQNEISVIDLETQNLSKIALPDIKFNPVSISNEGKFILFEINYSEVRVYIFKP